MKEIDAVITWVDGNDPIHIAKRHKYGATAIFHSDDVAGDTRFSNLGEIYWCVASLNKFAPFLHKIYIVTDEQDPHLEGFLQKYFPKGYIPVEVIDHKVIFRGYERYLPTFNSISLESMTWRIPGLSEYFIEFNDDLMLAGPVCPEDFFTEDGKVVCYADKYDMFWTWLTRKMKRRVEGRKKVTFKGSMMNAAILAHRRTWFLKLDHTPKALKKSVYQKLFEEHRDCFENNIKYRFRDASQFTPQELLYLTELKKGRLKLLPTKPYLFFLQPKHKTGYVMRKIEKLDKNKRCKFCCFNSMDFAEGKEREAIFDSMAMRLQMDLRE